MNTESIQNVMFVQHQCCIYTVQRMSTDTALVVHTVRQRSTASARQHAQHGLLTLLCWHSVTAQVAHNRSPQQMGQTDIVGSSGTCFS